jgi:hypothetical protein
MYLIDWMMLNRSCPFIFIGMGGLAPLEVEIQLLTGFGRTGRSNRLCDVQIFQKSYILHPDSELDVLYMDLDLLDETYPTVKSKLPFEDFDQGGLTRWYHRLDRPTYSCQFWVSTYASCFMAKLACQKTSIMIKIGRKR